MPFFGRRGGWDPFPFGGLPRGKTGSVGRCWVGLRALGRVSTLQGKDSSR